MNEFWPLYGALIAYFFFVLINAWMGFSDSETPITDLCQRHWIAMPMMGLLLGGVALLMHVELKEVIFGSLLAMSYFFFIHYSVGLQLFSVAQRSVSTNLLISLLRNSRTLSVEELKKAYGQGTSISTVTQSRLKQMEDWKWIEASADDLELTATGRRRVRLSALILRFFSLSPMGDS